jgi:hypothetical protein
MPVLGPQVHIAATGTVDTNVKKRMTSAASRKFRPNDAVPTMPKVTLTMLALLFAVMSLFSDLRQGVAAHAKP